MRTLVEDVDECEMDLKVTADVEATASLNLDLDEAVVVEEEEGMQMHQADFLRSSRLSLVPMITGPTRRNLILQTSQYTRLGRQRCA